MLFYIFQNIIFSILIIFIGNQIWEYLKNKYSRKITIDLVETQVQKYKKMIEEIEDRVEIEDRYKIKGRERIEENPDNSMEQELESFIETI
jgi:Mg2+ and Co2+ transporter CorA